MTKTFTSGLTGSGSLPGLQRFRIAEHHLWLAVVHGDNSVSADFTVGVFLKVAKAGAVRGAGSIADAPLAGRSAQRKELERLLIQLGRIQRSHGNANIRTKNWVEVFEIWQQRGI